ncbi:hypothetical protein FEE59_22155 [Herbaspirillum sp. RU 5E]|nr:hypothetical protein [Herbaspirillum sp. RU 5E]
MALDRQYQKQLLEMLGNCYPESFRDHQFFKEMSAEDEHRYAANMLYLEEHGLVISSIRTSLNSGYTFANPKITARGLDFLADDGGLSAILNVVTIKFHEETILQLIGDKIDQSDLPPPEKKKWTDALRSLPAESIKHLTMKLLDKGLENLPAALPVIQTFLQSYLK